MTAVPHLFFCGPENLCRSSPIQTVLSATESHRFNRGQIPAPGLRAVPPVGNSFAKRIIRERCLKILCGRAPACFFSSAPCPEDRLLQNRNTAGHVLPCIKNNAQHHAADKKYFPELQKAACKNNIDVYIKKSKRMAEKRIKSLNFFKNRLDILKKCDIL